MDGSSPTRRPASPPRRRDGGNTVITELLYNTTRHHQLTGEDERSFSRSRVEDRATLDGERRSEPPDLPRTELPEGFLARRFGGDNSSHLDNPNAVLLTQPDGRNASSLEAPQDESRMVPSAILLDILEQALEITSNHQHGTASSTTRTTGCRRQDPTAKGNQHLQ